MPESIHSMPTTPVSGRKPFTVLPPHPMPESLEGVDENREAVNENREAVPAIRWHEEEEPSNDLKKYIAFHDGDVIKAKQCYLTPHNRRAAVPKRVCVMLQRKNHTSNAYEKNSDAFSQQRDFYDDEYLRKHVRPAYSDETSYKSFVRDMVHNKGIMCYSRPADGTYRKSLGPDEHGKKHVDYVIVDGNENTTGCHSYRMRHFGTAHVHGEGAQAPLFKSPQRGQWVLLSHHEREIAYFYRHVPNHPQLLRLLGAGVAGYALAQVCLIN